MQLFGVLDRNCWTAALWFLRVTYSIDLHSVENQILNLLISSWFSSVSVTISDFLLYVEVC